MRASDIGEIEQTPDERLNTVLAAGGVHAALFSSPVNLRVEAIVDDSGQVTGDLIVWLPMLSSPYRVSFERVEEKYPF